MALKKRWIVVYFLFLVLILSLSLINAASYSVKVTNEHPFLLMNGKYVPASELKVGDELKTVDGKKARVTKITDVFSENPFEVYNLETALYHDFVLPGGIVVHNSDLSNSEAIKQKFLDSISVLRRAHNSDRDFLNGLDEIERSFLNDLTVYGEIQNNNGLKSTILRRLNSWIDALRRRDQLFSKIPRDSGALDLPDRGLYAYEPAFPESTSGNDFIEIDVSHYTPKISYDLIKQDYLKSLPDVFNKDLTGWTYFVSEPLPEGLSMREARRILGTNLQYYAGKVCVRNPERMIKFKVRVLKKRVWKKTQTYTYNNDGFCGELTVTKYAIAGDIASGDIISIPEGQVYGARGIRSNNPIDIWNRP